MGEVEAGDVHPGMQHLQHDLGESDAGPMVHASLVLLGQASKGSFERCLGCHGLHRLLHAFSISQIIVADRFQMLV